MTLFAKNAFLKMVEALLVNSYAVIPAGYANGKAGISLVLFELAKFTENENLEEHAYGLLKEVLSYDLVDTSFKHGKAGIAYVLDYLIGNDLLDADYDEIYLTEHNDILENIRCIEYEKKDCAKYVDYFFFINALSNHIMKEELNYYNCMLSRHIYLFLNENFELTEIDTYYSLVARLFSIFNSITDIPQSIKYLLIQCIKENEVRLKKQDFVCMNPMYLFKKAIYNELNDNIIPQQNNLAADIVVDCLDIKEKIDLVYDIDRLYVLNKRHDYRNFAKKVTATLINDDINIQEQILLNAIFSNSESAFGTERGLARILLLHICWEFINKGIFQEKINRLFA